MWSATFLLEVLIGGALSGMMILVVRIVLIFKASALQLAQGRSSCLPR
jgi:hypothetical protein